ncbi:hypothetical protein MKW98_017027 [Papaver atlanticum]|uniref:RNA-dependent RNA polymerase n=1 Tax=Papaver atlanticum TaxID=357466 RepID=A0AAD4TK84_9MAGN|nr:hypothetical protein MKW98_017027 [Papaver atlanticum]
MILSGIPISEPHLQNRLAVLMREDFKRLKEGKLPINESYNLMGTADPTGILNAVQVCDILLMHNKLLLPALVLFSLTLLYFSISFQRKWPNFG